VKKAGIKDRLILDGIKHHHERLDGSGYPDGLKIKRISEFGQILAVCDVFDALITVKPYRGAYSTFNALKLMRKEYKDRLNVKYINIFIKLLN
jgi:HD-GYP domain-containing protein (c-di-GMP phosphodiesterase class II)